MDADQINTRIEHPIAYPLTRCPTCGSFDLAPVVEEVVPAVHFLCNECDRCWTVQLGAVHRVAPPACFGCPERARCERAYAADHAPDH